MKHNRKRVRLGLRVRVRTWRFRRSPALIQQQCPSTLPSLPPVLKLSSPATREFWEIPVLFEDEHLLALDKPARLLTSPDRYDPQQPNLRQLLHREIERGAGWTRRRDLRYLMNAHRLDFETSGVLLLAKSKPMLVQLANLFNTGKPLKTYAALARGAPAENEFVVEAKLSPDQFQPGRMRVDSRRGKRAVTRCQVREGFAGYTLLQCQPITDRAHQIRVHLQYARLPLVGDGIYGGRPLLLSALKTEYRLKSGATERPLISRTALHAEQFELVHPLTGAELKITAPWPKDLTVAVKYLRRYASGSRPEAMALPP